MSLLKGVPASYRDPAGRVYEWQGRILRTIAPEAEADFATVERSGVLRRLVDSHQLIEFAPIERPEAEGLPPNRYVEHPRLPFISYPYEWSFEALRCAALHHLDVHLDAMRDNVTLTDASAYNVQFVGARPVFIDLLSFRPYRDGEFWAGYGQFCQQFLNPLLLCCMRGVTPNAWYRGALEGISAADLGCLLPLRSLFSRRVLLHVAIQGALERGGPGASSSVDACLPRKRFIKLLSGLRSWIARLRPRRRRTSWSNYGSIRSYSEEELARKRAEVEAFAGKTRPRLLWDIGCNTGEYALMALNSGAQMAIGWDGDPGAVDLAFLEAQRSGASFTPLLGDLANPSPDQGWAESERAGLRQRASADAMIALALIHHLVLTRNVPIPEALAWLVRLAPRGLIEFVPPEDFQVRQMLAQRRGRHHPYDRAHFASALNAVARVEKSTVLGPSAREIFWYDRST